MKNYAVELSAKGRNSKLAQKIWGEGHTIFVDAKTTTEAKIKAIQNQCIIKLCKGANFHLNFLKTTIC